MAKNTPDCEVTLDPEVYAFLEAKAVEEHRTLAHLMNRVLTTYADNTGFRRRVKVRSKPPVPKAQPARGQTLKDQVLALLDKPQAVSDMAATLDRQPATVRSSLYSLERQGKVEQRFSTNTGSVVWRRLA
jgi:predicted Rossmann fold nucleotide-binding protein DprA/Smf involved in DNA uptake